MALTFDQLEREALALPDAERAELAKHLWETIDPPCDPDIENAWKIEVRHRIQELDEGKVTPVPGEEVMGRLRERFGK
jgi:putative addiction module component (TIGR02574 family)